jgi:hypothetical protein
MPDRLVKIGGVFQSLGGGGVGTKILDETFDGSFGAFDAPHASWGINTDLTDFSSVGGVGRIGSTSERGLVLDEVVQNSLQIATVRAGTLDSSNRFRLKSRLIAGEATAIDVNWIAHSSGTQNLRTFVVDDGSLSSAFNAGNRLAVAGNYYALVMLTIGERMFATVLDVDSTDLDPRGENPSSTGNPVFTSVNDANSGWAAEHDEGQPGGGFMLSAAGTQNTGGTPSELHRWEIWDLGS